MHPSSTRSFAAALALGAAVLITVPAHAQQRDNQEKQLNCNDGNRSDRRGRSCEIRETTIGPAGLLDVDAGINGGVTVKGANRSDILVRARVEAAGSTDSEARAVAGQVRVNTSGGRVRAEGPQNLGRNEWWAVSYEVFVPHQTNLALKAHNGGLRIADVTGAIEFEALNGGVSLDRLAGRVRGRTTNGGLKVELAGSQWSGEGMDVQTTNGGVTVAVPEDYSAQFEAGTVNGGMHVDFPVTVRGDMKRHVSMTLGRGGAPIKLATTNGGVRIRRS